MGKFLLALLSITLFVIISPIGFLWQCVRNFKQIPDYFFKVALAFDQTGGVVNEHLLNDLLIKKGGTLIGTPEERISSQIGKNKASGHLKNLGIFFASLLNRLDKNHVENAIKTNIEDRIKEY